MKLLFLIYQKLISIKELIKNVCKYTQSPKFSLPHRDPLGHYSNMAVLFLLGHPVTILVTALTIP